MSEITKDSLSSIMQGEMTKGALVGVVDTLANEARRGDEDALKMLHALDFQQQLSKVIVDATKAAMRTLGVPVAPEACVAAAIANALETIGLEVTPSIHKEFDEIRAELAAAPEIIADRQKAEANLKARLELSRRCKAEGMSRGEIKQRLGELYNAQLKDFIVSNDAEEALAS